MLILNRIIYVFFSLCFLYSCGHKKTENKEESKDIKEVTKNELRFYKKGDFFAFSTRLEHEENSVCVNTICLSDTLSEVNEIDYEFLSPVVKEQTLEFYKHNKLINVHVLPLRKRSFINNINAEIEGLGITVYKIGVLKGTIGSLYNVKASGMCITGACLEFDSYYSMDGEVIYEAYNDKYNKEDLMKVCRAYGLEENSINAHLIEKRISVFWEE